MIQHQVWGLLAICGLAALWLLADLIRHAWAHLRWRRQSRFAESCLLDIVVAFAGTTLLVLVASFAIWTAIAWVALR